MNQNKLSFPSKVFLNGEIVDAEEALIPVFDRGFIFGDGIYEVIARINGKFFYKEAHFKRLQWCLEEIRIPFNARSLEMIIPELLEAAGLTEKDGMLYIQVSRGVAPRQHSFPKSTIPTVMMYAWQKTWPEINLSHASVVTMDDYRWSRCDIKSTSILGNVMANEFAVERGCFEALFIRNGVVTEASHCNVFFVKDEVLFTHPASPFILDGITRQVVLELCEKLRLEVRLEGISASKVSHMDEAFLTGTGSQVVAIRQLDDHRYFADEPGPITQKLQQAFLELKLNN